MKKCLAYLMAFALAALPVAAQAQSVNLIYDDDVFEASAQLSLPTGPLALPAPAVQFDAPLVPPGVYALDSVSFYLLQVPAVVGVVEPATYPVTVQLWNENPVSSGNWVPAVPIIANVFVSELGSLTTLDLTGEKLTFSGSVRIGIFLRDDSLDPTNLNPVPIPEVPVHLGVDTDGTDNAHDAGLSYMYDSTLAAPWVSPLPAVNNGIRAVVHFVPTLTCQGFLPPFNHPITMKKGGRTLPLKAMLFDDTGDPVTRGDLTSPPLVQLLRDGTEDVTDEVAPAGRSNKGQAFRSTGESKWMYNFKTKKSLAPGSYMVLTSSGDETEYVIDPPCIGEFVVEAPMPKKPHPTKGPK